MKKVLVFLLACLSGTVLVAQERYDAHWTIVEAGSSTMSMSSIIKIDGSEQGEVALHYELGIFCGDECRGGGFPKLKKGHYKYSPTIYGETGDVYTCRIWDHENNCELAVTYVPSTTEPIVFVADYTFGTSNAPYVIDFTTPSSGFPKEIYAYEPEDHWYLISSPVGTVDATDVDNLLAPTSFDLYYFDQADADGLEWVNYKPEGAGNNPYTPAFTQLVAGKGYLYASSDTITLVFNGPAHSDADTTINLTMTDDVEFKGWNLVGNPFAVDAYIDRMFYRMNADNTDLMSEMSTGAIQAMEGVFVIAENDQEEMTFSVVAPNPLPALALNLIESRGNVVDRAIVSFNGERSLPKFQLNPNHTKVYIPQENRDYAVVAAGEMGEMPVSFKAEKNGSYTLNFTAQEVSFAYLHLIDNKTGKDVDLLESPAYSFDALTTDYANRFKLVFATGNNSGDNFAFNSNGLWIISNEGEATLQVVDVTGRILSSETVSGCVSKAISAAPGVYMLRLINGDNMKVQKVVVK